MATAFMYTRAKLALPTHAFRRHTHSTVCLNKMVRFSVLLSLSEGGVVCAILWQASSTEWLQ